VLAAFWIDHEYHLLIAGYLAATTRLLVFYANNARRSVPVLSLAFPWLAAPALAAGSVLVLATVYLTGGQQLSWWQWLVAVVAAIGIPVQSLGLVAMLLRPVLITAKRVWLGRRLRGRWVTSAGEWMICDVRASAGDARSPQSTAVTLIFTAGASQLPLPDGDPPDFLVEVSYNREWQPPEGSVKSLRLADYPGPGPVKGAMFAAVSSGIRGARARLDEELVVVIEEMRLHGDDFFRFITSLVPTGRVRSAEPDR
jgi:hypothetical protein